MTGSNFLFFRDPMSDSESEDGEFFRCLDQILSIFSDFSDKDNFDLDFEYIFNRVKKFGATNAKPILTRLNDWNKRDIIETVDSAKFENLWECCWYLQRLIETGCKRSASKKRFDGTEDCEDSNESDPNFENGKLITNIYQNSVVAFSEYLSPYILDLPRYWNNWCHKLLAGFLQKLVPFPLPPLIWSKIISYLTPHVDLLSCGIILENFKIGTISKTEKFQVLERSILQESILLCSELVKMLGLLLYSHRSIEDVKYLSASITRTLQVFNSTMMRLETLLNVHRKPGSSSKCLNLCLRNEFRGKISDVISAFNSQSQDSMFFITSFICGNDEFEYNSPYFVWLEKGSRSDQVYRLIYVKKSVLASTAHQQIAKMTSPGDVVEIFSKDRPAIHCSGSVVAVVSSEETKTGQRRWFLRVWDLDASPHKELFKYKLDRLRAVYNKRAMATEEIAGVGEVGLTKKDSKISIVVTVRFKLRCGSRSVCTFVLAFDMLGGPAAGEKIPPKPKNMLTDSMTVGVFKKYVFAIRIGAEPMLILQNLENSLRPLTMVDWDQENPWEVRFNCNPETNTCILYRRNEIQLRKLDDSLTFIRDVTLCFEGCSPLRDPCYQFFDNTLYGWRRYSVQESTAENKFAKIINDLEDVEDMRAFFMRGFHSYDEQFVIDLAEESAEPVYFDTLRPLTRYTKPNDPSRITYRAFFTGFNPSGELQQMVFTSVTNDCSHDDFGNSGCYSGCQTVNLVSVKFLGSVQGLVWALIPDINNALQEHSDALAMVAKEEEERLKRIREEEQRKMELETKRKALVAKIAAEKKGKQFDRYTDYGDLAERRRRASKYINNCARFDCIITRWSVQDCYGFGEILIEGKVESVFIHGNSFLNKKPNHVRKGSLVQLRIEWDLNRPRPKALDTRM